MELKFRPTWGLRGLRMNTLRIPFRWKKTKLSNTNSCGWYAAWQNLWSIRDVNPNNLPFCPWLVVHVVPSFCCKSASSLNYWAKTVSEPANAFFSSSLESSHSEPQHWKKTEVYMLIAKPISQSFDCRPQAHVLTLWVKQWSNYKNIERHCIYIFFSSKQLWERNSIYARFHFSKRIKRHKKVKPVD